MSVFRCKDVGILLVFMIAVCCGNIEGQHPISHKGESEISRLERGCVSNLRSLNIAQVTYRAMYDDKTFARSLRQLGPNGARLLDGDLVSGESGGYRFRLLTAEDIGESHPIEHYRIVARPVKRLSKDQRSYYTDDTGVIRFTESDRESTSADPSFEGER